MNEKKRVMILFGGQSSEHEVSRVSAQSILKHIDRDKFDVVMVGITKDGRWLPYEGPIEKVGSGEWQTLAERSPFIETREKGQLLAAGNVDVIFPVLHGCNGEDGTIQGLFELAEIPYVGCGVLASAIGMDKVYSRIIFNKEGIKQAKYIVLYRKQCLQDIEAAITQVESTLAYPCFIKPSNSGSSVGVSKANTREELVEALKMAAQYDRKILVEEFIHGREIECAVLGNDEPIASTVGEIIPSNEFYDYKAKYADDNSRTLIPADLSSDTILKIRELSIRAYKALDCAGLSRVDFFVHKTTGEVYINEINTMPGFTSISMYPKLWASSGISYDKLIERLIDCAIERFEDNRKSIDK